MQKRLLIGLILIVLVAGLLSHLGFLGLRAEEPRRAIVSIETFENGNLIVPTIHEETYYNKPPLYNWIIAFFYLIFQSFDEWVVRLPGVLFFLLTGLITYRFTSKSIDKEHGILAALLFLTSADLLFYGSINAGEIDLFYSFIVVWQAFIIFSFFHKGKYLQMFLFSYILTFIGLFTKGVPSLAFQALTILVLFIYYKKWKLLFGWQHILGILLFVALTAGFLYLYDANGNLSGFLTKQFDESSDKSFNEGSMYSIFSGIFKFPLQFLIIALPWTLLLPLVFLKKIREQVKKNKLITFSIIFILSNILIYWISPGVRNRYLYMFIPFLTIIIARILFAIRDNLKTKSLYEKWIPQVGIVMSIAALLVFPFFNKVSQHAEYKWLFIAIFVIIFIFILAIAHNKKQMGLLLFILVIGLGRIWFNYMILPYLESRSNGIYYETHISNINAITKKDKVYWTGQPYFEEPELQLFGINVEGSKYFIPPLLPYALPYYQYVQSGHLLTYDSVPTKDRYYLGADTLIQVSHIDTLYQFKEKWKGRNLILFKLKNGR